MMTSCNLRNFLLIVSKWSTFPIQSFSYQFSNLKNFNFFFDFLKCSTLYYFFMMMYTNWNLRFFSEVILWSFSIRMKNLIRILDIKTKGRWKRKGNFVLMIQEVFKASSASSGFQKIRLLIQVICIFSLFRRLQICRIKEELFSMK